MVSDERWMSKAELKTFDLKWLEESRLLTAECESSESIMTASGRPTVTAIRAAAASVAYYLHM